MLQIIKSFFAPPQFTPDFSKIERNAPPSFMQIEKRVRTVAPSTVAPNIPLVATVGKETFKAYTNTPEKSIEGVLSWDVSSNAPGKKPRIPTLTPLDIQNLKAARLGVDKAAEIKPDWAAGKSYDWMAKKHGLAGNSIKAYCRVLNMGIGE